MTEGVDKSLAVTPAQGDEHWEQRYGRENKTDLFGNWNLTRARLRMEQSMTDLYENMRGSLRMDNKKGKKK